MILEKKSTAWFKTKKAIFIVSFLAISFFNFAVFWVYINFDTIKMTFCDWNQRTQSFQWNNFENYRLILDELFHGSDQARIQWWNSFRSIPINLIILPFAIITAYAFYKKAYGTTIYRVIFYLPSIISIVILTDAYCEMFKVTSDTVGPIAGLLAQLGINPNPTWLSINSENTLIWPLIYVFCIVNGLSTNVILINSAMQKIPDEISEAARLDGCSFFRELFSISIPLVMPTLTTWMTAIVTSVFGFYLQPMLIAGNNPNVSTVPMVIFNAVSAGDGNPNTLITAATYGLILSLFMLPFILIIRLTMKKLTPKVTF